MAPFVQRVDVKADGLVHVFDALYAVEVVFIITGTILALLVVQYRARLMFHNNLSRILTNVLLHYAVLAPLCRGAIIVLMLDWDNAESLQESVVFRCAATLRIYYVLVAALTLPAAAAERLIAVMHINDYEMSQRSAVSVRLIVVQDVAAFTIAFLQVNGYASIFVPLVGVTVPNVAAVLVFVYCHRFTMEFHKSLPDEIPAKLIRMYSLSLRYQTLENLRVAKLIKRIYFLAFALFACLVSIFVFATYAPDKRAEIVAVQSFDIGIALLAIAIPLVCLYQIGLLRVRNVPLCHARRCGVASRENVPTVKSLDSALDCPLDEEGRVYFAQLERMWA